MSRGKIFAWVALILGAVAALLIYWQAILLGTDSVVEQANNTEQTPNQERVVEVIDNSSILKQEDKLLAFEIDGEAFSFPLKPLDINAFSLPDKSADYLYAKLSERALNGEVIAARLLSDFIYACGETFMDEEQHKQAMQRFVTDKIYPTANPEFAGRVIELADEEVEAILIQFQGEFERCQGLTKTQRGETRKWAKIAADGGDFLGLQRLTSHPETSGTERIELFEKQWLDHGYIHAPTAIAVGLAGIDGGLSSFKGVELDPKKAYAYFLISENLNVALARYEGADSNTINDQITDYDTFESLLTSKLSASEHLEAEELAKQIMRDNKNCCTIDPRAAIKISADH